MTDESSFLGIPSFVWWMLLFVLGLIFATYFVRKIIEGIWPRVVHKPWWRERFLPLFPLFLGAVVAYIVKHYHYPEGVESRFTRVLYGFVMGGASGWIFKILKAKVKSTWGVDIDLSGSPPPPGTEVNVQVKVPPQDRAPEIHVTEEK